MKEKCGTQVQDMDVECSINVTMMDDGQADKRSSKKISLECFRSNQRFLPGLIIFCFAVYELCEALLKTATRLHIIRLSCLHVTDNPEYCHHEINMTLGQEVDSNIQKVATPYLISYTILPNGPTTVSSLFLGSWSDRHGRKQILLISLVGQVLACFCYSLSNLPGVEYIPGGAVCILCGVLVYGMCGKSTVFLLGASSYVADCSTQEDRTRLLSRLLGVGFLGNCVGFALVSVFALFTTFQWILLTVIIAAAILFTVILMFIKESVTYNQESKSHMEGPQVYGATEHADTTANLKEREKREDPYLSNEVGENSMLVPIDKMKCNGIRFTVSHIINFLSRSREQNDRGHIITLLICCFISHMVKVGELDAMLLYVTRERIGWDDKIYGAYLSSNYIAMSLQLLLLYPLLEKFFKPNDETCIILGAAVKAASLVATGLTRRTDFLFIFGLLGSFGAFVVSNSRSSLTKVASKEEVGAVLALTSFLEVIASAVGSIIFTEIFVNTRQFDAGIVFYVLSALQTSIVINILCFRFYVVKSNARSNL